MVAMTSKFNFECVIQYHTDQWLPAVAEIDLNLRSNTTIARLRLRYFGAVM